MRPGTNPWVARVWREYHAGNLTRAAKDVLMSFHTFRGHGGACWPSHEPLASRARCCVRTVQRALQQAQHLGLASWSERRVKAGWRWLRTSNWYRFAVPAEAVQPGQRSRSQSENLKRRATTGQQARGGK
ncbi:helix-turn-helix domain-containing protein [Acidisphaera sp. L21]|uniref:helix-turn-helix domain-containing protein n=1 Tax=Acidisphaera sp. L21 TaxID=1641851 RepID=UPI001C204083